MTDRQTDRQTVRQTDRQTGRQTHRHDSPTDLHGGDERGHGGRVHEVEAQQVVDAHRLELLIVFCGFVVLIWSKVVDAHRLELLVFLCVVGHRKKEWGEPPACLPSCSSPLPSPPTAHPIPFFTTNRPGGRRCRGWPAGSPAPSWAASRCGRRPPCTGGSTCLYTSCDEG